MANLNWGIRPLAKYRCIFHQTIAARLYDCCRHVSKNVLKETVRAIWSLYIQSMNKSDHAVIIDAGVGSGRLFAPLVTTIPFALREKTTLVGLDISLPMIQALKKTLNDKNQHKNNIILQRCDIQKPYPKFEYPVTVVYTLATFHILTKWKQAIRNVKNVLSNQGFFVYIKEINQFMHQTEGFEGNSELASIDETLEAFMREYHKLRKLYKCPYRKEGILYSDISPAILELSRQQISLVRKIDGHKYCWKKPHRFFDILQALERKLITTWGSDIPKQKRLKIAHELHNWLIRKHVNLDRTFNIPSRFELYIFRKS